MKKYSLLVLMILSFTVHAQKESGRYLADYYSTFLINGVYQGQVLSQEYDEDVLECINATDRTLYSDEYLAEFQKVMSQEELDEADRLYAGEIGQTLLKIRNHVSNNIKINETDNKIEIRKLEELSKYQEVFNEHRSSLVGQKIEAAYKNTYFMINILTDLTEKIENRCGVRV